MNRKSDAEEDDAASRRNRKGTSAAQRRKALKAMLERRQVKKVLNRQRKQPDRATGGASEQGTEDVGLGSPPGTSASPSAAVDASPPPSSSSANRARKRVRQALDSSDSEGERMESDENKQYVPYSAAKPSKRSRLLDSDPSDDDNNDDDKESRNNSALNYNSDGDAVGSQSQSQGLLDFGDDSDEGEKKKEEKGSEDESSDDDVPLMVGVKRKAQAPESFPATMLSQGPPGSDDSDLDDHVALGALKKKRRVISDDEDD